MPNVVLHQWDMSPYCNKVRRILKHKGIDYSVVNYNGLMAAQASKLSAVGKLPVLDWDGERIQDSSKIALFLDRKIPAKPLYPTERRALADVRLWEDWAGQSLYFYEIYFRMLDPVPRERALDLICEGRPRWERSVLNFVFKRRYPKKLKAQGLATYPKEEVERMFFERLDDIEVLLEGREFLVGDAPTIADYSVVSQLDEIIRTCDLAPRILAYPRIRAWMERC
jgi:glutathione S-transferase